MTETVNLRFTIDGECDLMQDYLEEGIISEFFLLDNSDYQAIIKNVDETLIESLNPDDLAEFIGIDSEFVIAIQVLEFA
jgi:hypothetical protein